jgi:NADH:ubiquinone oxidoreductase subunit B-like Fe-S oxidoreductase
MQMDTVNAVKDSKFGQDQLLNETVVLTRLDKAIGWARKYSLFPYPFATACCAMEYMSLSMSPYDIDRQSQVVARFKACLRTNVRTQMGYGIWCMRSQRRFL